MEYSWITGSVAWYTNTMENYLVGARPSYAGLVIEPHLPFASAKMTRTFRGAEYEITINNPEKKAKGYEIELIVDGKAVSGNVVPDFKSGKHTVAVNVK
jgi:cellobiose phosphorylase